MGLRQIICDGFEDSGAKNGGAVGRASKFQRRADGDGLGDRRAGLGQVVYNDRTD